MQAKELETINKTAGTNAKVFHVTNHPGIRFNDMLGQLSRYGWKVEQTEYVHWRARLEEHVLSSSSGSVEDNALFPLLHFVLDDLPTSTKSPELDDRHTQAILDAASEGQAQGTVMGVDRSLVATYLAWLLAVGFLPTPSSSGAQDLPKLAKIDTEMKAIGRGSAN